MSDPTHSDGGDTPGAELQRLTRALSALRRCNSLLVRATSEQELLESICQLLVEDGGYRMAWVGFPDAATQRVLPVAAGGSAADREYLEHLEVGFGDDALGRGPTGVAIRTGALSLNRDSEQNPAFGPWKESALKRGFRSSIALPLAKGAQTIGALMVYAAQSDAFDEAERALLQGFANDLAYGLEALRTRAALQESETRLRQLAEGIDDFFWLRELASGRLLYVSSHYQTIWGRSLESLYAEGRSWLDAIHPDDRKQVEQSLPMQRGGPWEGTYRIVRPDGTVRWIRARSNLVKDAQGRPTRLAGVARDITLQRELEHKYLQSQKLEAVGRLASGVAHDFNNLLSVIMSYSQLALRGLKPEDKLRDDLEEVSRAAERASELTRQLLAFGRQQALQPRVVNLSEVVRGMEKLLRRLISEDIELVLTTPPEAGAVVIDPAQVEQIVMNLAVNARDAMPQGGRLSISTAGRELESGKGAHRGGAWVVLEVSDSGSGMDAATRERIFEPFFTTKEQGKGTGLGLATVFSLVEQSHGHIEVWSEPGKGSRFTISLPRATGETQPVVAPAPRAEALGGSETVLLVEDDEQVRGLARAILQRRGYTVLDAPNGDEALALLEKSPQVIHLLIADAVMPRMSGRELAERLAPMRPRLKVLYISGHTAEQAGLIGASGAYLAKPLTPEVLLRKVREVLDAAG